MDKQKFSKEGNTRSIFFVNDNIGYIVGDRATILKTLTGGD